MRKLATLSVSLNLSMTENDNFGTASAVADAADVPSSVVVSVASFVIRAARKLFAAKLNVSYFLDYAISRPI